jgi:phosphoglycerol geranylgeranyltransferase
MPSKIEAYLLSKIKRDGAIHLTLLDPENVSPKGATEISREAEKAGTTAITVGGSTVADVTTVDSVVKAIKNSVKIPVILFPNNVTGVSRYADAIWFMSLLNSSNPYFITGVQALASTLIKKYRLEPISMGYVIVGEGGAAGLIGQAHPVPYDKPKIAVAYALAAKYLGMRFVYLEAGSGAMEPVPAEMIHAVKKASGIYLIVGGGIKRGSDASKAVKSGADIIVTGTVVEEARFVKGEISEIVQSIKAAKHKQSTI